MPTRRPQVARAEEARPSELEGKLIFQTTIGGDFYTVQADGTGLQRITDGVDPTWSPDGAQIAFTRWREPRGVWVVNADGSDARRIFDWTETRWPTWSPDGDEILFTRQHGGRLEAGERCFWGFCFEIPAKPHWKLGIVELQDGAFREPLSQDVSLAPDWSPDGTHIVYDGERGLVVSTPDGETWYEITDDSRDTGPVWSPDGSRVAFTRRQHDHWEVYVVGADGAGLTRLTDTPRLSDGTLGNSAAPAWSPDGQHLAFLTDRSGRWEIWLMAADGSGQKPMFETVLAGPPLEYGSVGERAIDWTR
jgi:TolB protein